MHSKSQTIWWKVFHKYGAKVWKKYMFCYIADRPLFLLSSMFSILVKKSSQWMSLKTQHAAGGGRCGCITKQKLCNSLSSLAAHRGCPFFLSDRGASLRRLPKADGVSSHWIWPVWVRSGHQHNPHPCHNPLLPQQTCVQVVIRISLTS